MCDECGANVQREPVKFYAIVEQSVHRYLNHAFAIIRSEGAFRMFNDEDGEYTYVENDYDKLSGFVAFDGHKYMQPNEAVFGRDEYGDDADDDTQKEHPNYWPHDAEWPECISGKWRPGTAQDAIACGLFVESAVQQSSGAQP